MCFVNLEKALKVLDGFGMAVEWTKHSGSNLQG